MICPSDITLALMARTNKQNATFTLRARSPPTIILFLSLEEKKDIFYEIERYCVCVSIYIGL